MPGWTGKRSRRVAWPDHALPRPVQNVFRTRSTHWNEGQDYCLTRAMIQAHGDPAEMVPAHGDSREPAENHTRLFDLHPLRARFLGRSLGDAHL